MDVKSLNLIPDTADDFICGKPIQIDNRVLIPLIEIFMMRKKEFLTCSINPSAILLSERLNSTEYKNCLIILNYAKESGDEKKLMEFIDSKKSTILEDVGIQINIDNINIIYSFKDVKNEKPMNNHDFDD